MKRIVLSIITIAVALSLASWATFAVWSDSVTIASNHIQTGTADLLVSAVGTSGPWDTSTVSSSLTLSALVPGSTGHDGFAFSLKNNSTDGVNFNVNSQITSLNISGTGDPDQSKLLIAIYPVGSTPDTGSGWISASDWQSSAHNLNSLLTPGDSNAKSYNISAKLSSSAGNEWQGRTVTFTLTINGQQP